MRRRSSAEISVDLVVDLDARHFDRADFFEHARHGRHVALAFRIRRVDHVQHQIGVGGLFERGAKRGHQRVRQPIDEADGVAQQQLAPIGKVDAPHQRIERDEQRIRRFGIGLVSRLKSVVLPALV